MTWRNRPLIGFDLETDSPNPDDASVVTACVGIAAASGWNGRTWLLKPARPISAEATAIHGITTEHAEEHGQDRTEALAQIRDDLYRGWEMGCPVVIFNAPYDTTTLDRNLRSAGLGALDIRGPILDPLVIDKAIDRFRKGSRKLIDTCAHYGITLTADDAHGAEADARAACRLAWRLAGAIQPSLPMPLGDISLDDLHQWQAEQYEAQRASFAAYLARQGQQLDDPSTEWPLRTYHPAATVA